MSTANNPLGNLTTIPLSAIIPSPTNPRKNFDATSLGELADSIKNSGLKVPIQVRNSGEKYEIIAGERRWRAAGIAKLKEVPAIVCEMSDEKVLELQMLENLQREDLHPMDEAVGYQQLLDHKPEDPDEKQMTVEVLAKKIGKSASYVYQRLKLAALVPSVRKAFADNWITAGHAIDIARLQPADQDRCHKFLYHEESNYYDQRDAKRKDPPSVREVRRWVQDNVHVDLAKATFDIADEKLLPAAGSCITCPKMVGNAPVLFEGSGLGKKTCTDPKCFNEKRMALVQIKTKEIADKDGVAPVPISDDYSPQGKKKQPGVLYENQYETMGYAGDHYAPIKKGSCPDTKVGVYVDGDNIGKVVNICTARDNCKTHTHNYDRRSGQSGSSDTFSKQRKALKIYQNYSRALVKALADKVTTIKREDLELIAIKMWGHLGHYSGTPLAQQLGWVSGKNHGTFYGGGNVKGRLPKMKDAEILKHLLLFAVAGDLISPQGYSAAKARPTNMEAVAKRHGVNASKIRQELVDAQAARGKKKAKATAKKKVPTSAKAEAKPKAKAAKGGK